MSTDLYTNITIGEDTYSIKKFPAKTGLKLARLVIAKAAPLIPLLDTPKAKADGTPKAKAESAAQDDHVYEAVGTILDSLSDEDIDDLVDKCLRVCYLNLPAGLAPVIDEFGNYGVENVEYDMSLTIRLCFEAIKWGASDFFGGKNSTLAQLMAQVGLSRNQ